MPVPENAHRLEANHATEILVQRVECVRLQFAKDPPEPLFDPVDHMEETTAVNFQLAATQAPVGAQKKMVLEDCVLDFVESAPADEAEIGDVFLLLAGVDSPAFASPAKLERNRTDVLGGNGALPEAVQARAKDRAENAIAGNFRVYANQPDTDAVT
jgi:hypothetical protein